jgi:hypothetical protein
MKEDNEEVLSRYRLQFHMMHFLIRLSACSSIMKKYCGRNRMCKRKKDKEKLTEKKKVMEKWGKRSEGNNGEANKRNNVQEKK